MKKFLIAAIASLALAACGKEEKSTADITLYFMPGCPHCHHAIDFFAAELSNATIEKINVTEPGKNQEQFLNALKKCGLSSRGVPLIIVKGECIQGYAPEVGAMIKELLGGSDPEVGAVVASDEAPTTKPSKKPAKKK